MMSHRSCLLSIVLAGVVAALILPPILGWFRNEEDWIRLRLDAAAEGFNEQDLGQTLDCFAESYRDASGDLDKGLLTRGLRFLFFRSMQKRGDSGPEEWSVDLDAEQALVTAPEDVDGIWVAEFAMTVYPGGRAAWDVQVRSEWACSEATDGEWRILRSSYETQRGERPW